MKAVYSKLFPTVAFVGINAIFIFAGFAQAGKLAQYEYGKYLQETSVISTRLQAELNSKINLVRGLVAFASTQETLSQDNFNKFASTLLKYEDYIINFAILENTTMRFIYPYEQNKTALGIDLSLVPDQSRDVFLAKASKEPVLSSPLALVQGGTGIVSRIGIFKEGNEGPLFWGIASVAIDIDKVLEKSGIKNHPSMDALLEGPDNIGLSSKVIFGSRENLDKNPISIDIKLPGAVWILSSSPKGGWKSFYWLAFSVSGLGMALAGFSAFALYKLIKSQNQFKVLAFHDQLTALPNRMLFWDRFSVEAIRVQREASRLCIFMLDLDSFKSINDEYGHEAGDRLLAETAKRLKGAIRRSDTVARLGGDEFAIIAPIGKSNGLDELTRHIRSCFSEPFDLGVVVKTCEASLGYAIFPDEQNNIEAALSLADERMYKEKHLKHGRRQ
ncbi:diguanylate cyclase [Spirochaetota bacterium]